MLTTRFSLNMHPQAAIARYFATKLGVPVEDVTVTTDADTSRRRLEFGVTLITIEVKVGNEADAAITQEEK